MKKFKINIRSRGFIACAMFALVVAGGVAIVLAAMAYTGL